MTVANRPLHSKPNEQSNRGPIRAARKPEAFVTLVIYVPITDLSTVKP
jgi:hypothetical protein